MKQKFAIVIEPSEELSKEISEIKQRFKDYSINDYIDHPNHLTLLHGYFEENDLIKVLENFIFKEIEISTNKIECFENDLLTDSKTLFLSIQLQKELIDLQLRLIEILKDYIDNNDLKTLFLPETNYGKNLNIYNYPYVGSDWIPHFTICSLENIDSTEYKKTINKQITKNFKVNKIIIFKVNNSEHLKIAQISS